MLCTFAGIATARPNNPSVDAGLSRGWYAAQIGEFLTSEPIAVIGHLAANGNLTLVPEKKDAWLAQIEFLQAQLPGFFRLAVPRIQHPADGPAR